MRTLSLELKLSQSKWKLSKTLLFLPFTSVFACTRKTGFKLILSLGQLTSISLILKGAGSQRLFGGECIHPLSCCITLQFTWLRERENMSVLYWCRTDWSPCSYGSMNCPWFFISHDTTPAQRLEASAPTESCHRAEHRKTLVFVELGSCSPFLQQDTYACLLLLQQQPWHPCQVIWPLLPAHTEVIQTSVGNAAVSWSI